MSELDQIVRFHNLRENSSFRKTGVPLDNGWVFLKPYVGTKGENYYAIRTFSFEEALKFSQSITPEKYYHFATLDFYCIQSSMKASWLKVSAKATVSTGGVFMGGSDFIMVPNLDIPPDVIFNLASRTNTSLSFCISNSIDKIAESGFYPTQEWLIEADRLLDLGVDGAQNIINIINNE